MTPNDQDLAVQHEEGTLEVSKEAFGGNSVEDLPDHYYRRPQFIASFLSFALGFQATYLAYVSQGSIIFAFINPDIGPSKNAIWAILVLSLIPTVGFPVFGRLSDVFGRRWFFITGNVLVVVGSITGGRASTINMLIGGNIISSFGFCTQQLGVVCAVPELVPYKWRYLAFGAAAYLIYPLSALGPAIARALSVYTEQGWRWCFYLPAILSGIAMILQLVFYHPPTFRLLHKTRTKKSALKTFDWVGLILFSGSVTVLLLGLSWGGQEYPWKSGHVIASMVIGGIGLTAFFSFELFWPLKQPLIPPYLLKSRQYMTLCVLASVGSMIWYAQNIIWPIEIGALFQATGMKAGFMNSTISAAAGIGEISAALFAAKIKHTKIQIIIAAVIFTAFTVGLAGVTSKTQGMAIAFTTISSVMVGYMEVLSLAGAPMIAHADDIGVAGGVVMFMRSFASTLAVSIYSTVLQNEVQQHLVENVSAAIVDSGLSPSSLPNILAAISDQAISSLLKLPGMTQSAFESILNATTFAYQDSFKTVYLISLAFGIIAIAAGLASSPVDERLTTEITRKLQGISDSVVVNGEDHGEEKNEQEKHVEDAHVSEV